jgi:hypothetical protein
VQSFSCCGPISNFQVQNKFSKNAQKLSFSKELMTDGNKIGPNSRKLSIIYEILRSTPLTMALKIVSFRA